MSLNNEQRVSPWPHRLAVLLVCAVFPLIWVGGLVTTYDAGMAVPDWPDTYGYNLFAYPISTWFSGPWDLFIEHGHRLLGALAGLITIALLVAVWRTDDRIWLRWLCVGALLAVIGQGVLGGLRVLADERQLAKIHGCTGPLFFALAVSIAVVTSRRWRESKAESSGDWSTPNIYLLTAVFAFVQLVIGANLRHVTVTSSPHTFSTLLMFHLLFAAVVLLHAIISIVSTFRMKQKHPELRRPATALLAIVIVQLALGVGTYVVKYAWPSWATSYSFASGYTVEAKGWMQANITTAHVAMGSLILAISVMLFVRSLCLLRPARKAVSSKDIALKGLAI